MNKPSIEEALKTKLPVPWKVSEPTGTRFLVIRRRPDDLTKELFEQLEHHGVVRNTIRELFYISSNEWGGVMKRIGIEPSKRAGRRPGCGRKSDAVEKPATVPASPTDDAPIGFSPAESRLKTTPPAELPKVPVAPILRAHDIGKPAVLEPKSAAAQFAEMASDAEPTEDADGLNYQDRHNLGIDDTSFSAQEDGLPIPLWPEDPVTVATPPANSAKLQITCHDYSLGQLKNILASLPAGTTISGTIHIAL